MNPNSRWHHFRRRLASVSRWLHIYLSMFSFAVLLFFAATGLTLNHAEFFSAAPHTTKSQGQMDAHAFTQEAIVAQLRKSPGIKSALAEFRLDETQAELSFKGPGYVAEATVNRATGKYTVTETRMGLVAVLNDLHKGRDSGQAWSAIIDVSAIVMSLVSATGLILIFFLHKRRVSGLLVIGVGAVICYVIYVVWVP
jgi:hypothetical protein